MTTKRFLTASLGAVLGGRYGAAEVLMDHAAAQVEWLRSKGGFFHPKLEFQRLDEHDLNLQLGIFASEDIPKGETLMIIPQSCRLALGSEDPCETAYHLLEEFRLGDESEFAPYVKYLFDGNRHLRLPSAWSEEAKDLLRSIVGKEMPPDYITDYSFEEDCEGSGGPVEEHAYLLVISRSWDYDMVPILDMINHRNGRWLNVDSNSARDEEDITAFASRNIVAGEQLHLSYNECTDCQGLAHTYVLPHILRDYGFVEQHPQRWIFHADPDLVFELDTKHDTRNACEAAGKQDLTLFWLSGEPETHQIDYLRSHLKRLKRLSDVVQKGVEQLTSSHERDTIIEFFQALKTALERAIWTAGANEDLDREVCKV